MRSPHLEELASKLRAEGLRPIIDHDLDLVRIDCPVCQAHDKDTTGLYKPAEVIPRKRWGIRVICNACGECSDG